MVINKRMGAINKALANAKWWQDRIDEADLTTMLSVDRMQYLQSVAESEICGHISLKYRIEYHESIFKPYYDGLVTKDELLLALEGAKFSDIT